MTVLTFQQRTTLITTSTHNKLNEIHNSIHLVNQILLFTMKTMKISLDVAISYHSINLVMIYSPLLHIRIYKYCMTNDYIPFELHLHPFHVLS